MALAFYNTLTRKTEQFNSIEPGKVRLYTCGPTVYNFAHIGNLRTYVFEDILRRTIEGSGYVVNHVMNVTDVGHLQSDADEGDDKMAVASQREKKSPWDIAKFYEQAFFDDCRKLHIKYPSTVCRATEHIKEMQDFVVGLQEKGFAYVVDGNVYFRISKFPSYAELSGRTQEELTEMARVDADPRKEDQRDFVLWFSQSKYPNQIMKWDSPWGVGFPGWHIECTVMASKYLGEQIDIHTGGVDHISVHHSNEIAQAEALFGSKWVNYWLHGEFLVLAKEKMAKSAGNFLTVQTLIDEGYDPLHYRYLCLGAHYRSQLIFSYEALSGARNAFESLKNRVLSWKFVNQKAVIDERCQGYQKRYWDALHDDLNTAVAMSVMWEMAKDDTINPAQKLLLMREFDTVLGFDVDAFEKPVLSDDLRALVQEREGARASKDFKRSDELRDELLKRGIQLKDTPQGTDWYVVFND